jgi:hypothetical protein
VLHRHSVLASCGCSALNGGLALSPARFTALAGSPALSRGARPNAARLARRQRTCQLKLAEKPQPNSYWRVAASQEAASVQQLY